MGAIAPIDFQKCLFAPIDFEENPYCDHHFCQLIGANILFITHLHPLIKNPKEGPVYYLCSKDVNICNACKQ